MQNKKFDPFKNLILDKYEQEIEGALNRGEFVRDDYYEKHKKEWQEAAHNLLESRKSKSITLRVNQGDLIRVKAKAKRSNIAYQTLINLLINKYAEGELKLNL